MYREYWGLSEFPFENVPDPRFFFPSSRHQEALMRLFYAISGRKGAAMLTGEVGCGKTILSRVLIQQLPGDRYEIALIPNPNLPPIDFLSEVLYQLGTPTPSRHKSDLLHTLNDLILNNLNAGKDTVIIVDEAHIIREEETFEELRLLLNFQLNERFLVTLVLIGQPELKERVDQLRQLSQRIAIRYHLDRLNHEETADYIRYRLEKAGAQRTIFTPEALQRIHQRAQGVPRKINNICDMSLLLGYSMQVGEVDAGVVDKAVMAGE